MGANRRRWITSKSGSRGSRPEQTAPSVAALKLLLTRDIVAQDHVGDLGGPQAHLDLGWLLFR